MFRNDANRIGYIIIFVILFFGTFCIYDLNRMLNLKSQIFGYFQHTTTSIKINDFEYNIEQLLFTNSGTENEYFAEVKMNEIVTGFDKTKNYTLLVNDTQAARVNGNFGYVNVDFMNKFYSTNETLLLTDTLNIKINFYTDSTKIIFITQNGEQAVKLWTSFIQKNGLNLKIIEDNFNSKIEADVIAEYTINFYFNDELIKTSTQSILNSCTPPTGIGSFNINSWEDENGFIYEPNNLPFKNCNLYANVKLFNDTKTILYVDYEELDSSITTFNENGLWTDGIENYYSYGVDHYVWNKTNKNWQKITWHGLESFIGKNVWNDGTNVYYSTSSSQFILNKETSTWQEFSWVGFKPISTDYIWTDGTHICYSNGSNQYILDKENQIWNNLYWTFINDHSSKRVFEISVDEILRVDDDIYWIYGNGVSGDANCKHLYKLNLDTLEIDTYSDLYVYNAPTSNGTCTDNVTSILNNVVNLRVSCYSYFDKSTYTWYDFELSKNITLNANKSLLVVDDCWYMQSSGKIYKLFFGQEGEF